MDRWRQQAIAIFSRPPWAQIFTLLTVTDSQILRNEDLVKDGKNGMDLYRTVSISYFSSNSGKKKIKAFGFILFYYEVIRIGVTQDDWEVWKGDRSPSEQTQAYILE